MQRGRWAATIALAALMGCGPASVGGRVDGAPVGGARDAVWDEVEIDLGPLGEWSYTTVLVSDIPDSCTVLEELGEAFEFSCEERCEEYLEVVERYRLHKDSYYTLSLEIDTTDGFEGIFPHDDNVGEGEFKATFTRWDVAVLSDPEACEEACREGELFESDSELANSGELELGGIDRDELRGRFGLEFDGDDGLRGSFRAYSCDLTGSWDDWLF